MGLTYRVCRQCGEEWNVAVTDKGSKVYLCHVCRGAPWEGSRPGLSRGWVTPGGDAWVTARRRGGDGHRRNALDQSGPGGGTGGQGADL